MFDRQTILQTISDVTKDATGSRVRLNWEAMTDAELEAEYNYWVSAAERTIADENAAEVRSTAKWNAHIAAMMVDNNIDRATALRWDMDAMGATIMAGQPDTGYYCYLWGISYENGNTIKNEI